MAHDPADYAAQIRTQGFRLTSQRCLIMEAIGQRAGHLTLDEIWARTRTQMPTLNRATLYRNLAFLCQLRLVVTACIDGQRVYEIAGLTPHAHLVCQKCGVVVQIDHAMLKTLFAKVERECQFAVDTNHLALLGLCQKCRED